MVVTRTKVENDRLDRLLNSPPTTKIRSSQFSVSATISKRPFHELEFLVGGWWVVVGVSTYFSDRLCPGQAPKPIKKAISTQNYTQSLSHRLAISTQQENIGITEFCTSKNVHVLQHHIGGWNS